MSEEALKLTTYFGERDRFEGRLVGDALLDLYGRRRLRASVLLRGAEGFGALHRLHTDRVLSLSEDLPVVSVAVDERERIEGLLGEVQSIQRRGLITLERALMLTGETGETARREEPGQAAKLTVHVGRGERAAGRPAYVAVCELLRREGIEGATVLLGVDGTRAGERRRARFFARNAGVPLMVVAVGASERLGAALPALEELLEDRLLTLERLCVCKRDGRLLRPPHEPSGGDAVDGALWQKLTVYGSQAATVHGRPLNVELVRRLRDSAAAGATSVRGIWGFHGEHAPHGERLLQLRRHVPVVTVAIDTPERIARSFRIVDELTAEHGLVTSERVPALSARGEGARVGELRLAKPGE